MANLTTEEVEYISRNRAARTCSSPAALCPAAGAPVVDYFVTGPSLVLCAGCVAVLATYDAVRVRDMLELRGLLVRKSKRGNSRDIDEL